MSSYRYEYSAVIKFDMAYVQLIRYKNAHMKCMPSRVGDSYIEKTVDGMNISGLMQGTKSVRNISNSINPLL